MFPLDGWSRLGQLPWRQEDIMPLFSHFTTQLVPLYLAQAQCLCTCLTLLVHEIQTDSSPSHVWDWIFDWLLATFPQLIILGEKRPLFTPREVESYLPVFEEHIPSRIHSCNHKYNLSFKHLLMGWIVSPQNLYFEVLTLSISKCDSGNKANKVIIKVKWGHINEP